MIKAIVDGRKTVTRRLDHLREINKEPDEWYLAGFGILANKNPLITPIKPKPRYQVCETVYIKEAFWEDSGDIYYKTECPTTPTNMFYEKGKWKSPLFLPRIFARYFIKITKARIERLCQISTDDAICEGFWQDGWELSETAIYCFQHYWDSINKSPYDWNSNPWVWVYSFEKWSEQ